MASKDYLFVNKDSRSPSLSRNTGVEASLASRVNKHVQQQRFWKSSDPRQSWYRPFVRSDSGSSAPSPARSDTQTLEDSADTSRRTSLDQLSPRLSKRPASVRVNSISSRRAPKSSLQRQSDSVSHDLPSTKGKWPIPWDLLTLFNDPGAAVDAFKTIAMPLTPTLVEVVQRYMRWAISASVTQYTVQEGVKRVFASILQDKMRAAAFLAVATAQQKKVSGFVFPSDQGPELYSYQATKMIREYIENHQGRLPSSTLIDIFRLAVGEWMNGNHDAARIHFAYISKLWNDFEPQDAADHHIFEVCSSEEVFFAVDIDEKPLLGLNWLPRIPAGPQVLLPIARPILNKKETCTEVGKQAMSPGNAEIGQSLITFLRATDSSLTVIFHDCIAALGMMPNVQIIDFGSALVGPLWSMKRLMHATLHRLQSLDKQIPVIDDSIRRSLVIVLLLASTTSERRVARIDLGKVAMRLKKSLERAEELHRSGSRLQMEHRRRGPSQELELWLWMYTVGMAATADALSPCFTHQWFRRRALLIAVRLLGFSASSDDLKKVLSRYLYFDKALGEAAVILLAAVASCPRRQAEVSTNESAHSRPIG